MKRCAHKYEEDITKWGDKDRVFLCLHCDNKRYQPNAHLCDWGCWDEHHPQEFVDD
jgi:hypothetical protein